MYIMEYFAYYGAKLQTKVFDTKDEAIAYADKQNEDFACAINEIPMLAD